jgi:hypothetical protein
MSFDIKEDCNGKEAIQASQPAHSIAIRIAIKLVAFGKLASKAMS